MNRILCSIVALSIGLFAVQCAEFPGTGPSAASDTKSVKVAIRVPAAFDTIAARAEAVVSAPGMQTITAPLAMDGDTLLTGIINNIPAGANRFFEVFVYGFGGGTEYYGCANADISSRDTTYVTIVLRKPYGTAVINGYIEDFQPGDDHLSAVTIPYIVKYWTDTIAPYDPELGNGIQVGLAVEFATTPVTSSVPFDTVFYSWAIVSQSVDTMYQNVLTGAPSLVHMFNKDGRYMVMVKASCMLHAYGKTSGPLYFTILNGAVYPDGDTAVIPPIDTISPDTMPEFRDMTPPVISFPWNNPAIIGRLDTLDYSQISVVDNVDGDVSSTLSIGGNVIYSVPGTYTLQIKASDRSGNVAYKEVQVRITRRNHENSEGLL